LERVRDHNSAAACFVHEALIEINGRYARIHIIVCAKTISVGYFLHPFLATTFSAIVAVWVEK
jgi:hypothetical protein